MSTARGVKSRLVYVEEATFNTAPTGTACKALLTSGESMDENIATVTSDDIRPDREVPAIESSNLSAGGSVNADFAIQRSALLLKHLIGSASITKDTPTPNALTAGTAYVRGDYASVTPTGFKAMLCCTKGGSILAQPATGDTTIDATSAVGDTVIYGGLEFVIAAIVPTASSLPTFYRYTLTGGSDFPAVGLSFEKQLLGGNTSSYTAFTGTRVDGLDLSIQQGGIVKAVWNLLSMQTSSSQSTILNPSQIDYPTDAPLKGTQCMVLIKNNTTGATTFSTRPVREASFSIHNNTTQDCFVVGSRARRDLPPDRRAITGRFTSYFEDTVEYDVFKKEQSLDLLFSFIRESDQLTFEFAESKLTGGGTPKISGSGVVTGSYDFSVFKRSATNTLTVKIVTTVNNLIV